MKKLNLLLLAAMMGSSVLFAGGLVTNTNQSATWARMLARQGAYDIDAVYFNPAGLAQLNGGLHLSLTNQSIFQTQQITNDYPYLAGSPKTYEGSVQALFFPSVYAVFKLNNWAFSAGVNVIGGGGGADFTEGLPSFEIPMASLVPMLQGSLTPVDMAIQNATGSNPGFSNITGYGMEASFNGTSRYLGYQVNATYAINDLLSVAIGARYVMASNSYSGSLSGVTIAAPALYGGSQPPGTYVRFVGDQVNPMDPVTGAILYATANVLDAQTADKSLEASQKGSGITPIVGVNLHLSDMLNVGLKYEHHTTIEMENSTTVDEVGMFPDGAKSRADLPGMISAGVQLRPLGKLTANLGYNMYFDRSAFYGNHEVDENGLPVMEDDGISFVQVNNESTIDANSWDLSLGLEYGILNNVAISAGYSIGNNGVNDSYQSDMNYSLKTSTVAGGFRIGIGKMIGINAGLVYVMYEEDSVEGSYQIGTTPVPFNETYNKNTMLVAVGLDINL